MKTKKSASGIAAQTEMLRSALVKVINGAIRAGGRPSAIMFSGGFDSAFLYEQARKIVPGVAAVTVAFDGYNRRTVLDAERAARLLKARHLVVQVSLEEYISSAARVRAVLNGRSSDHDIPLLHAAFLKLPRTFMRFWAGMGSDQWFGEDSLAVPLSFSRQRAAARVMVRQHVMVAADARREIFFPFLEEAVLAVAARVPSTLKKGKRLLRSLSPGISALSPAGGTPELQVPGAVRRLISRLCLIQGER